jgi:hypothetical protein
MKLNVTLSHFEELIKKSYSLDIVFLLKMIEEGISVIELCSSSAKICNMMQTLVRKGLITKENKLTIQGADLLKFMEAEQPIKIVKTAPANVQFEEWWKAFPGTDTFTHKGVKFDGSRSLRKDKEGCKLKFDKILEEGEYTAAELIAALNYDVLQKKENSVKQKSNRLTYLQNSFTYLHQRSFEPFIELIKQGETVQEAPKIEGGTDI